MSDSEYGQCLYCGGEVRPPITQAWWCDDGCMYRWRAWRATQEAGWTDQPERKPRPDYPRINARRRGDGPSRHRVEWGEFVER